MIAHWPGATVDLPSGPLHVRRASATSSTAERAVLLHGLGGGGPNWTDLMGLLRDRLDCAAPDLPGFGWSPPPATGAYTLTTHVAAITELIERDGPTPVHLLGNSLGGTVATVLAATRPDLVRTLTLVSPALPVLRPRLTNVHLPALAMPWVGRRLASRLAKVPLEHRMRAALALTWADPSRIPPERLEWATAEILRREALEHDGPAMIGSLRSLMTAYLRPARWPLWRLAARVQAPTLLVYGLLDRLVDPRTAYRAERTFPDARLVLLPDAGHVAQMEFPDVVATAVRRLVDEPRRPPRLPGRHGTAGATRDARGGDGGETPRGEVRGA